MYADTQIICIQSELVKKGQGGVFQLLFDLVRRKTFSLKRTPTVESV